MTAPNRKMYLYFRGDSQSINNAGTQTLSSLSEEFLNSLSISIFSDSENDFHQPKLGSFFKSLSLHKDSILCVPSLLHIPLFAASEENFFRFLCSLSENSVRIIVVEEELDSEDKTIQFFVRLNKFFPQLKKIFKSEKARLGLREAKSRGKNIGRPKETDYEKIYHLRTQGLSLREISAFLDISKGSVQNAMKREKSIEK